MNITEIIAEVENKLKVYAEASLIDRISLKSWCVEAIKEQGGNIMEDFEVTLEVRKGRAKLPDNFWALRDAVKCEPLGYYEKDCDKKDHAQSSFSYVERTEITDYYNSLANKPCEAGEDCKYITETHFFRDLGKEITVYYHNYQRLYLKRHKNSDGSCSHLFKKSPYEISIGRSNNYLNCNFNHGSVAIKFRGLPVDEDGELYIPDTSRDKLKNYIIYKCVVNTLEDLMLSEDHKDVGQKIAFFKQREDQYYIEARAEIQAEGLRGWKSLMKQAKRLDTAKQEAMFRNL